MNPPIHDEPPATTSNWMSFGLGAFTGGVTAFFLGLIAGGC